MKRRNFFAAVMAALAGLFGIKAAATERNPVFDALDRASTTSGRRTGLTELRYGSIITDVRVLREPDSMNCELQFSRDGGVTWTEVPWVEAPKMKLEGK